MGDHHRAKTAWGPGSPFCRLIELNARLLGLGAGFDFMTPLHVVECLLREEVPFFRGVFGPAVRYRWKRSSGETGENQYLGRIGDIRPWRLRRHFGPDILDEVRISNLKMIAADAKPFIEHAVTLGRRGITMYVQPAPKPELFIDKERVA